jgi:hypothetical protein
MIKKVPYSSPFLINKPPLNALNYWLAKFETLMLLLSESLVTPQDTQQ